MILSLLILVFAVLMFAWLTAGVLFIAMIGTEVAGLVSRVSEHSNGRMKRADARFLHDVGIRP